VYIYNNITIILILKYLQEKAFDFTIPIYCMELLDISGMF